VLPNGKDESITKVVRDIAGHAQANAEEKGLRTLFVAPGMATWNSIDGGQPADVAVLLFPVVLETKRSHSSFVSRARALQVNLVLLHLLDSQFGVKLNPKDLIPHLLNLPARSQNTWTLKSEVSNSSCKDNNLLTECLSAHVRSHK
jgi:hypothetical protein